MVPRLRYTGWSLAAKYSGAYGNLGYQTTLICGNAPYPLKGPAEAEVAFGSCKRT